MDNKDGLYRIIKDALREQARRTTTENIDSLIAWLSKGGQAIDLEFLERLKTDFQKQVFSEDYGDYYMYIESPAWHEKAIKAKELAGWRCQLCNKEGNQTTLHAHHRTYERLGFELDGDIIVLCAECHAKFHNKD